MTAKRHNGEGSIYPYRNGYAAYVWVTKPDGTRDRKYAYGKTREATHEKWLALHAAAKAGPVATTSPTVGQYLAYWLKEVVEPHLRPTAAATYESHVRNHIAPHLGAKARHKLTVRDVQTWVNRLAELCQCCEQGKDAARPPEKQRCCALGKAHCCEQTLSPRSIRDIRDVLRSALGNAVREEVLSKNVAAFTRVSSVKRSKRKAKPWTAEEAKRFLVSARDDNDPLFAAYVLILVLGMRKGEVLGLTWDVVDLDARELDVQRQLQRVGRQLLHTDTAKTEASEVPLPLPDICTAALRMRRKQQDEDQATAGEVWEDRNFVFSTRHGTPYEPRNFNRSFDARCEKAKVRRITVHNTRDTCGTLLVALDVHPRVVMRILRHTKIAVTMEIYAQAPDKQTREALRSLGEWLD
ncbi:site-specific integrase [Embleya sp. NPDC001921]